MSEKVYLDLTSIEKKSQVQDKVQEEFFNALREFLESRYTEVRQVGNADLGVVVGSAKDDDGFTNDVVVVVHGTVKHWYDQKRTYKGEEKDIPRYDLEESAEEYENDPATIKRNARIAKRKEAEAKIKEREKAKQEKEQNKS